MVFVTGGSGLIGSHLLLALCRTGKNVKALIRDASAKPDIKAIFDFWEPEHADLYFGRINWTIGDILEIDSLKEAMEGCNEVYHAAALVSFHPSDHKKMEKVNVEGTANVVNTALHFAVEHFCFISSVAAIGRTKNGQNIDEKGEWKTSPLNSKYAITKYSAECEVWRGMEEGLNVVILNPGLVLGPVKNYRSSASIFGRIKKGLSFYPEGASGFVDVRDVADAMINLREEAWGNRYILVAENISYKEVFSRIARGFQVKEPYIKAKSWLLQLGWRLFALRDLLFRTKSAITRESARNAGFTYYYNSQKVENILGRKLRTTEHIIEESCRFFTGQH